MNHWSDYWKKTTSTNSFVDGDLSGQYSEAIQLFWEEQFVGLAEGAYLLDVGTGNGAIAIMASRYSVKRDVSFRIFATDLAAINPIATFQHLPELRSLVSQIRFFPETSMESLPFASGSMDLITSQFAFEYSSTEQSLAEFSRILKPNGRCTCIAHDVRSALVRDSMTGISVLSHLLEQSQLLPILRQLFAQVQNLLTNHDLSFLKNDLIANRLRNELNANMAILTKSFSTPAERLWLDPFLRNVLMLFSGLSAENVRARMSLIETLHDDNFSALARIQEQVNAAITENKMQLIKDLAVKYRLGLHCADFFYKGAVIGRALHFTKK